LYLNLYISLLIELFLLILINTLCRVEITRQLITLAHFTTGRDYSMSTFYRPLFHDPVPALERSSRQGATNAQIIIMVLPIRFDSVFAEKTAVARLIRRLSAHSDTVTHFGVGEPNCPDKV